MNRWMLSALLLTVLVCAACGGADLIAQTHSTDQVEVSSPIPTRQVEPPPANASAEELETRADQLRAEKAYLDAIEYYRAAIRKSDKKPTLYNKVGISELLLQRYKEASKDFERAIKLDRNYADAHNNLGVIRYEQKKYGKAINEYEKAIKLDATMGSYFSNLGAAYFAKKKFDDANEAYSKALAIDPDIFDRISRTGVAAQLSSPEDRAHFNYVLAKLYAKAGDTDRSLLCLRRALEEGYKEINNVYKDTEFAGLRKDPRFTELMAAKPTAIPE
jgi:tetratricopeptide (TPR) repeat protein